MAGTWRPPIIRARVWPPRAGGWSPTRSTSALLDLAEAVGPPEGQPPAAAARARPGGAGGHGAAAAERRARPGLPALARGRGRGLGRSPRASSRRSSSGWTSTRSWRRLTSTRWWRAWTSTASSTRSIPNKLLERIDVDAADHAAWTSAPSPREALEGIDIGDLIQELTASIGVDTVEAARVQAIRADEFLARIVDRILDAQGAPPHPGAGGPRMTLARSTAEVRAHQGRRAGIVSRLPGHAVDFVVVVLIWVGLLVVGAGIRALFTGHRRVRGALRRDPRTARRRSSCSPTSPTAGASTGAPSARSCSDCAAVGARRDRPLAVARPGARGALPHLPPRHPLGDRQPQERLGAGPAGGDGGRLRLGAHKPAGPRRRRG